MTLTNINFVSSFDRITYCFTKAAKILLMKKRKENYLWMILTNVNL